MKDSSLLQHLRRLVLLEQRCGSSEFLCMYNYLMNSDMNPFTKRSYLQSLLKHKNISVEQRNNIYDYCAYLRHAGYRDHDKYKKLMTLDEIKALIETYYQNICWEKLFLQLFAEWPLRDNIPFTCISKISALKHKSDLKEGIYPVSNFFYVDGEDVHCVIANTKTVPKYYKPIDRTMSFQFAALFFDLYKKNIETEEEFVVFDLNQKTRNDKLIAKLFRQIGVEGGSINYLRRVHRQNALKTNDIEAIRNNAMYSFHSLDTANVYND